MRFFLLLLLGCAEPPVQTWECTATEMCDGQVQTVDYTECSSREDLEDHVMGWGNQCEAALFIYGCGSWSCGTDCHPTGDECTTEE